jgi:hypothetical protein
MAEEKSSGQTEKVSDESVDQKTTQDDKVAYDTYKRVLAEKKKMQERLELLEKASKEREETELKEKEKWKDYATIKEKEALEFKQKYDSEIKDKTDMIKMSSFLDAIDGSIPKEYWPLIDVEKIVVDPATNMPDPLSVQSAAKEFQTRYHRVIEKKNGAKTSQDAPNSTGTLTYDEWKALPLAEMRKRYQEIRQSEKLKGV